MCVAYPFRLPRWGAKLPSLRLFEGRSSKTTPTSTTKTLSDTLEGLTDLREMLAEIVRSALDDEAICRGLSTRLADMKARLDRLETRAKKKRALALRVMSEADIPKLAEPDFTASLKQGAPALEVRR